MSDVKSWTMRQVLEGYAKRFGGDSKSDCVTCDMVIGVLDDRDELREALTQAHELTATQAGIIERRTIERDALRINLEDERKLTAKLEAQIVALQDELAARDHSDAMKDERPL